MMMRKLCLPEINWSPQEEACATGLVNETLRQARAGTVQEALAFATAELGFDSFVFGIVANDRRPDAESRTYVITNQADAWIRAYDERAYLEQDPRVELAGEPGFAFWEAGQFHADPRHRTFLRESAAYGIASGLVIGLCTRDPPSYAMLGFNRAAPVLDCWSAEQRSLLASQASILGKVLSRTVRRYLNEQELLFPAPPMKLNLREREILTFAAAGKTSKEIAGTLGVAKITVDMHVGTILSKMGALNRNQAIAKAIANKMIHVPDDVHAEYKSAKLQATRRGSRALVP
ncbi:MAG TPA: autoinducer binding domain-containing protein [Casimicrobiaceae bacterium]|jgi:LuxR family quorum sensing-dependent transcriptional regulator|nr:autoinducer binding domain-containing protein [Casimicrobiaceae bacterium]